jgi:hypothetical protein
MIFKLKFHPLTFFILNMLFIIVIIATHSFFINISIILLVIMNVIFNKKTKIISILTIIITLIPIFLSYYVTSYIMSTRLNFNEILEISTRVMAITFASILFALQIDFEDLIHYFMRKFHLPVKLGYSLISAVNAIEMIFSEFKQLKLAYTIRYAKNVDYYKIIPNLFISTARFAYYNAISLSSRNLQQQKTYIRNLIEMRLIDYITITINCLIVLILIIYN